MTILKKVSNLSHSDTFLSLLIFISAAAWGMYWFPLREIEAIGFTSTWAVVLTNACPLIVLLPLVSLNLGQFKKNIFQTCLAATMIGLAFTFYAVSLVETTVIRATILFYLNPIWSTLIGLIWLSERQTLARIISIIIAVTGLYLLLYKAESSDYPINLGDLFGLLSGVFWSLGAASLKRWPATPLLPLTTLVYLNTTIMSLLLATFFFRVAPPSSEEILAAFPIATLWSIILLMPGFIIIFKVSKLLFPGKVGILMMSEVIVAIISASILIPEETMNLVQWLGATAIIFAGLVEILFGRHRN